MPSSDSLFESVSIERSDHCLHLARFRDCSQRPGLPVLLLHGAVENGRIFYSQSGKGFAPFLAQQGFDVFVADLRGRGLSTPKIDQNAQYGQYESITQELPAFSEKIAQLRPGAKQLWGAHSWGGVLMLSALARFPELLPRVSKLVFFGTKRSIHTWSWDRLMKISLFWNRLAPAMTRLWGFLPAKRYGFGSDDETKESLAHSVAWVKVSEWVDPKDGFDYGAAIKRTTLPPLLHLAGEADKTLGNINDIRALMAETGFHHPQTLWQLGRAHGSLHDYDHITMLTHPDGVRDHFPRVLDWINQTQA